VLVVRHAEVFNPRDILYARLPRYRLSDRGRQQAALTERFLSTRQVNTIYTSPLLRARQTAQILAGHGPARRIHVSKDLIEVRTSYQGSPNSILKTGFSFYEPRKDPNDETMKQIFGRLLDFLKRAVRQHAGETIAAVSHADPISIMRLGLQGQDLTAANLHAGVYPARSSVTQVCLSPEESPRLCYFDVAEAPEVKL
jgi:broad specificity phosphatase PhoE